MSSGSSLTSKLYDKIIKMLSKSHETIPLIGVIFCGYYGYLTLRSVYYAFESCVMQLMLILIECTVCLASQCGVMTQKFISEVEDIWELLTEMTLINFDVTEVIIARPRQLFFSVSGI
jgi:hypothetical protein